MGIPSEDDTAFDGAPVDDAATEVMEPEPVCFTRGANPRAAVAWVRHIHGDSGVRRLAEAVPISVLNELGVALRPKSMSWVSLRTTARLLETIDAVFGKGDERLIREVGRYMARHDFPSLAKPVARLLSPGLFVDMSTKIWRLYHSHGSWEILRSRREITASLFNRPEHHRAICESIVGWIEGAMVFCGATDVVGVEERCAARGGPCCSIRVRWTEASDNVVDRRPRPPT